MSRHVLVPIDGSGQSNAGLVYAASSFPEAAISVVYVVDPRHDHVVGVGEVDSPETTARRRGERILESAAELAADFGHDVETILARGEPHGQILETIVERDVDHVVMGSHGESPITRPYLGHVSEAVVRRSPVPTTVVPESTAAIERRALPGRVLVPVDGSAPSTAALRFAFETFPDAEFTAFHVLEFPVDRSHEELVGTYLEELLSALEDDAEEYLQVATSMAEDRGVALETATEIGRPATEILERVLETDDDQVVIGSHGRGPIARLFTGSVAERVVTRSPRTVTVVREVPG